MLKEISNLLELAKYNKCIASLPDAELHDIGKLAQSWTTLEKAE